MTRDGGQAKFSKNAKSSVVEVIDSLSGEALRVLAIAIKCIPELPFDVDDDSIDSDARFELLVKKGEIRFMGLVAAIDPPREGVKEAVEAAGDASIRVVMITGDYYATARAIARNISILSLSDPDHCALDCGALRPDGEYLEAPDMDLLTSRVKVRILSTNLTENCFFVQQPSRRTNWRSIGLRFGCTVRCMPSRRINSCTPSNIRVQPHLDK